MENEILATSYENVDKRDETKTIIQIKEKPFYDFVKRFFDIFLSVIGIIVLFVPILIIGLIVVIDSPGSSPIYKQKRIGANGKEFEFFKIRSMVPGAEGQIENYLEQNEMSGPVFKIKDDPRITRFGRFIRRTSIDELPQLWNVIKGDMSLVGPRPPLPREVEKYDDYQKQRLMVTPGITCLWQVQPKRNEISFEDWVKLDLLYIENRGFITDIKIMFKTVGAVLGMEGE